MENKMIPLTTFDHILDLISDFLIRGVFIGVLVIFLAKRVAKNKIETDLSFQIIRWTILIYACCAVISFICFIIFHGHEAQASLSSFTWIHWLMLIANCIIPLTLFHKKLGRKLSYILLISFLMNIGWLFESFIIHFPGVLRSFETKDYSSFLPFKSEMQHIIRGFVFGIVALIIGSSIKAMLRIRENRSFENQKHT